MVFDLFDGRGMGVFLTGKRRMWMEELREVFGDFLKEMSELNREGADFEELVQQGVLHSNFIMSYNLYDKWENITMHRNQKYFFLLLDFYFSSFIFS